MDLSWDDETVEDAVEVLEDLVLWELAPQRWAHVAEVLGWIDVAWAAGDGEGLRRAVAALIVSGPVRMMRIGSKNATGIPQPVLDRRNKLVHSLTTSRTPEPPEDDRDQRPR